jgi:hypothetical protein
MIQTCSAAYAKERFALLRISQEFRSAIVEQHQIKLVGSIDLARAAGTAQKRCIDRERLSGSTASKQFQKHSQILRARNQLFETGYGDVDFRRRRSEPCISFVLDEHDGS